MPLGAGSDDRPSEGAKRLAAQVEADGGQALAFYREPVGGHWQVFGLLPIERVLPTPYQRDLSAAHVKRLHEVIKKVGRFVDPVVVVSPEPGVYWTPNGHHRRTVLAKLKGRMVPAILIVEPEVAFQILALNTEKAHNLKEKSLEVIRMHRGLTEAQPGKGEQDFTFEFESAHLITLGLLYERNRRFAGGAFAPILRRVDGFLKGPFPAALAERERRAAKVRAVDEALERVVAQIKKRGIRHPFVKSFVLSRTTPLTRQRKTLPSFDSTFVKLLANLEVFDAAGVRFEDIQRTALAAAPSE